MTNLNKITQFALLTLLIQFPAYAQNTTTPSAQPQGCAAKPFPESGCRIGNCVNGRWEQICDFNSTTSCGVKPVAGLGCKIGQCYNGQWQQICDNKSFLSCGPQPTPLENCKVGGCVDGKWQQICN